MSRSDSQFANVLLGRPGRDRISDDATSLNADNLGWFGWYGASLPSWEVGMPRAGQVKPPVVERLSDRIAIGVLTTTFPPELVDRVVAESGRTQQRQRLLPARVVVWLVLAMALFSGQAYEEVARLLAGGRGWARRWPPGGGGAPPPPPPQRP